MTATIAEELAKKQKQISVAEFFERNKQILGFDSLTRAVLTSVKEGVDNSLDACEEASILPEIYVEIKKDNNDEYTIIIEDNGPGIVKKEIPNIFGRLLYGSRFYSIRQSRGQQGIGISAAIMYAQLTTGKPTKIISKIGRDHPAYYIELIIDTKRNRPDIIKQENSTQWGVNGYKMDEFEHWMEKEHGTRIELHIKGKYERGEKRKQNVYEYLKSTAIVNPHAQITLKEPNGELTVFHRATEKMPAPTKEIKPHPLGIELGTLLKMAKATDCKRITSFLQKDFARVSLEKAKEICGKAGVPENLKPRSLSLEQAKSILDAIHKVKMMAPSTDCLSPIGDVLIKKGLKNVLENYRPDFYVPPITRSPKVYSGNPFQVEVGIVHGGNLPADESVQILRYANRVPLLYQQGDCVCTKAVENIDWRHYGLEQRGGHGIPRGPAVILIHVASTNIPFTSESKEAIADIPEIREEIEKALRECGRKLNMHIRKKERRAKIREKFEIVQKVLPALAEKSSKVVGKPMPPLKKVIAKIMDVVWIDDSIEFENGRHKVRINIMNYTSKGKSLTLYAVIPDTLVENINPKPRKIDGNKIVWDISRIPSTESKEITFELFGLEKDDYDENELYVDKINPIHVIGAEPWQGVE